jgi:hypothetical protein
VEQVQESLETGRDFANALLMSIDAIGRHHFDDDEQEKNALIALALQVRNSICDAIAAFEETRAAR